LFLELKLPKLKPTPTQLEFAQRALAAGAEYRIAYSVAEALDLVAERGMLKSTVHIGPSRA
jgi:hypothetical protein